MDINSIVNNVKRVKSVPVYEGDGEEAGEVSEELLPGEFPEGAPPPPDHTPLLRHGPRGHRAVGSRHTVPGQRGNLDANGRIFRQYIHVSRLIHVNVNKRC